MVECNKGLCRMFKQSSTAGRHYIILTGEYLSIIDTLKK